MQPNVDLDLPPPHTQIKREAERFFPSLSRREKETAAKTGINVPRCLPLSSLAHPRFISPQKPRKRGGRNMAARLWRRVDAFLSVVRIISQELDVAKIRGVNKSCFLMTKSLVSPLLTTSLPTSAAHYR